MNWFLNDQFTGYGLAFTTFNEVNPMLKLFPKLTKCTYAKYGPSGSIVTRDALCILPLNVVNEKVFVFLWFWFYLLTVLTGIALIYRIIVLFVPRVRVYLLMAQARYISKSNAENIIRDISFGDYFILYQLGKNLNPFIYRDLITGIAKKTSTTYNAEITLPI